MAMAILSSLFVSVVCLILPSLVASTRTLHDSSQLVAQQLHRELNDSRRNLGYLSCGTGNPIDDCWRCRPDWIANRQTLADCAIGFGKNTIGGKDGKIYVVTDSRDPHPVNVQPGTLRHAVVQTEPLWIIFHRDMTITLKEELIMTSNKTIDGRGANVIINGKSGITVQYVSNVIIHGITIKDMDSGGNAYVRSRVDHWGWRTKSDGDAIGIFGSQDVWVDHCTFSNCKDGLIDVVEASTGITISNNYFSHHDKVMLLGHNDTYSPDENMRVTVAYNHFAEELTERMPRCRLGVFHVVNNLYSNWKMYAIGGSEKPTILSQGNKFIAQGIHDTLEVTKHLDAPEIEWQRWNWLSIGDQFVNGAFFVPSGSDSEQYYAKASSLKASSYKQVEAVTAKAGTLSCEDLQC